MLTYAIQASHFRRWRRVKREPAVFVKVCLPIVDHYCRLDILPQNSNKERNEDYDLVFSAKRLIVRSIS